MSAAPSPAVSSRRNFLQTSTAAAVGVSLAASAATQAVHAAGSDVLKVALIGCGGRGTGAAVDAMAADKNAKLTVLADVFPDQVKKAQQNLKNSLADQFAVTDDNCFSGFDAYKQVMASDVDVVLLATPPHFRPAHLRAAIEAKKHVFCEKPVAVDAPGVRSVLETSRMAKERNLNIVSGLCWRYDHGVRATVQRIREGAIGDIVAIHANYLTGTLWHRDRKPEWSDMEYQVRNWLYYTWLSGDHNNEQHIHTIDKCLWLMNDQPPVSCVGMGGRQVRTESQWGNIYDHFGVVYEWANGVRAFCFCRQNAGCYSNNECYALGPQGRADMLANSLRNGAGEVTWTYAEKNTKPSMYRVEHQELFKAIRAGSPINNGEYMSYSTLMAIMGRESAYTGQRLLWQQAMDSKQDLTPAKYEWGPAETPAVAMPGKTKFV